MFSPWAHYTTGSVVHFGDIKLERTDNSPDPDSVTGRLLVYFGTNKASPVWGTVCTDNYNDANGGSVNICNMLGYETGEFLGGDGINVMKTNNQKLVANS